MYGAHRHDEAHAIGRSDLTATYWLAHPTAWRWPLIGVATDIVLAAPGQLGMAQRRVDGADQRLQAGFIEADALGKGSERVLSGQLRIKNVRCQALSAGMQRCGRSYGGKRLRSEEHTSELQSLMRISYAVFCLKKKNTNTHIHTCSRI